MIKKYGLWIFLLLLTLLRLRVATQFGMTVDEAHYVLYGKFLDWSYFDHPPMVGWIQSLFHLLPLNDLLQARLPALLLSLLTSKLILNYLLDKNVSQKNAALAVAALNLTPMFNSMAIALLPDSTLMPLTILIVSCTEKIFVKSEPKLWLRLGLLLGLAALSKYTAALYVISLMVLFGLRKKWGELLKPGLWLGALVSAVLISPVIYWNLQHHFASLQYQAGHVFTLNAEVLRNLGASFAIQLVSWGIGPFLVTLIGLAALLRHFKKLRSFDTAIVFASVFLLFFVYISFSEVLLPHWMLMFFVLMLPISYAHLLERKLSTRFLTVATFVSALLTFALLFEMAFRIFPARVTASLYEGVYGWDELLKDAGTRAGQLPNTKRGIAVMNWTLGSRAMYYNNSGLPVFVIDSRRDQFDIWNPESPVGFDLIVIVEKNKEHEHTAHLNCAQLTTVGEKISLIKEVPVNDFLYYHCANFLGYKE